MHFVKLTLNGDKLEEIVGGLDEKDLQRFKLIANIIDKKTADVWISKSDLPVMQELVSDAIIRMSEPNYQSYTNLKFIGTRARSVVPVLWSIVREMVDLVGFSKVFVCYSDRLEDIPSADRDDPSNYVIILDALPQGFYGGGTKKTIQQLRFGMIATQVPHGLRTGFRNLEAAQRGGWNGRIVKDDDEVPLALFKGNRLWVAFDPAAEVGKFDKGWYPTMVMREIVARALGALANAEVKPLEIVDRMAVLEGCRADFVKNAKSDVDNQRKKLEQEISTLDVNIETREKAIASFQQALREKRVLFDALMIAGDKDEALNKEFDMIKNHVPLLRSISFTTNGIIFETEVIDLEGDVATHDKQLFEPFPLGRYQIELKRGQTPHVTNLTKRIKYTFAGSTTMWDHPHVKNHGPCLGSIKTQVSKLIREDKWFGAITYIIEALKTYNSDDGWSPVGLPHWQAAAQEREMAADMDDEKKDRIAGWVSYRHRMPLGLCVIKGQRVIATCPDTCPLKDKKCELQGVGVREGLIQAFYEDTLVITWSALNGKMVGCTNHIYETVTLPDGSPIVQTVGEADPVKIKLAPVKKAQVVKVDDNVTDTQVMLDPDLKENEDVVIPARFMGFDWLYVKKNKYWIGKDLRDNVVRVDKKQLERLGLEEIRLIINQIVGVADHNTYEAITANADVEIDHADMVLQRFQRMQREQGENPVVIPTINITGEDVPDMRPDIRWTEADEEVAITPEDDDIMEAFETGIQNKRDDTGPTLGF